MELDPGQLDRVGDVVDERALQALARVEVDGQEPAVAVADGGVQVGVVALAGAVEQVLAAAAEGAALRTSDDFEGVA